MLIPINSVHTRLDRKQYGSMRLFLCNFFNPFMQGYFWPVLNTIHVYLTLYTLQNPFLTIYFKKTIISMLNRSLSLT